MRKKFFERTYLTTLILFLVFLNGAVLTLLAVSNCTHKESYWDICVTSCIIPVVVSLVLSFVWGLFI